MRRLILFPFLAVLSILILPGYKSGIKKNHYQSGEMAVSITLDSINPGPIRLKQLASVKEVVAKSGEISYHINAFDLVIVPSGRTPHSIKCIGNKIPQNARTSLQALKPGDFFIIAN